MKERILYQLLEFYITKQIAKYLVWIENPEL